MPDASAGVGDEFIRLASFMVWKPEGHEYRVYRAQALREQFARHYGHDAGKLEGWQSLCEEVRISVVPNSITQCKKALAKINVNLIDLIDSRRTGQPLGLFQSKALLMRYTCQGGKHKKMFPKEDSKENGFLKGLLKTFCWIDLRRGH